jgi:hypothetical protein
MYRIYTEDKNRESIFRILDAEVDGYTVTPSIGCWKGQREASLAIDLVDTSVKTVRRIAALILEANHQESVLVVGLPSQSFFVTEPVYPDRAAHLAA